MNRNRGVVTIILVTLALLVTVETVWYKLAEKKRNTKEAVSLILFDDGKNWENLKAGAKQAAENGNVDLSIVAMSSANDADQQYNLIVNEFNAGADRVIVAAVDKDELAAKLKGQYKGRITFALSSIGDGDYVTVANDNYKMGMELGLRVVADAGSKEVAILDHGINRDYLNDRKAGLLYAFNDRGYPVEEWMLTKDGEEYYEALKDKLENSSVEKIIVINEETLSDVIKVTDSVNRIIEVYAISNSDEAVYLLDSQKIKLLAFPDEFGIGYEAVSLDNSKKLIQYKIVDRKNMYKGEYEKVLFPFVK